MVRLEDLYEVYYLARKNKRRSEDAVLFELDYERRLRNLCTAINERTYRANDNYTFISMRPKPREVFACELEARLIQWYVIWRTLPLLERTLTKRSFNNRPGMGTDAAIERIAKDIDEVSEHYTKDAYIIQWDLQGYFPNAITEIAREQLQKMVCKGYEGEDKDDILWMILIAINANPQRHCYRKSPLHLWSQIEKEKSLFCKPDGVGGAIGFLIWQVAMNLYLNDVDRWAIEDLGLHYVRFVDDTIIVAQNKECALALLPLFRERYATYGCRMHPRKFYCQHYSKGAHILGAYIKFWRIYAHERTIRNAKQRIAKFNRTHNLIGNALEFRDSINSYFGLLKHRCEFKTIRQLYGMIADKWKALYTMNWDRLCLVAAEGYGYKDILKYITR